MTGTSNDKEIESLARVSLRLEADDPSQMEIMEYVKEQMGLGFKKSSIFKYLMAKGLTVIMKEKDDEGESTP